MGGAILPIEVQTIPGGSGKIELTGSLGDVMKESAHLAVTFARVHAGEYGIDPEQLKNYDLHIHAPEGAVPKDGPSAGVTLATALISCPVSYTHLADEVKKDLAVNKAIDFIRDHAEITEEKVAKEG